MESFRPLNFQQRGGNVHRLTVVSKNCTLRGFNDSGALNGSDLIKTLRDGR